MFIYVYLIDLDSIQAQAGHKSWALSSPLPILSDPSALLGYSDTPKISRIQVA